MKPSRYFFSYSRSDSSFVKKLAADLENAGFDAWLDHIDIQPGSAWDESIQHALNDADAVLAVMSNESTRSKNVMDEIAYAISMNKRIIPLVIEDCHVPFRLARLQHIDFTGGYDEALAFLQKTLLAPSSPESNLPSGTSISTKPLLEKKKGKSMLIPGLVLILMALLLFIIFRKDENRKEDQTASQIRPSIEDSLPSNSSPEGSQVHSGNAAGTGRINLFAPENGVQILIASSDDWKYTVDNREDLQQLHYGVGGEAVYGFKDDRTATFDLFTMLITQTETYNIKEFELLAGNESPQGPFQPIGKFKTQNVKLFKTPYQEFRFEPVTAKYLKFRLISTYDWPHPNIHEFQLFGRLN